jgi:hypothetical protein
MCEETTFGAASKSAIVLATLIIKFHYRQILELFKNSKKWV